MATHINTKCINSKEEVLIQVLLQQQLSEIDLIRKMQTQAKIFQQTLFQYIMQYQLIDPEKLCDACAAFFNLKKTTLHHINNITQIHFLSFDLIQSNFLLPIEKNKEKIIIAIANPDDIVLEKILSFQLNTVIELQFVRYDTLYRLHNALINAEYYKKSFDKDDQLAQQITHQLLSDALHRGASDIHFEPHQQHYRVRFRIDGLLHNIILLPHFFADAITSCIKVLSQLDIAIKRTPQDGRLAFRSYLGFFKDGRVNTCPTIHGEKIVVRLLDANTQIKPIEKLGLSPEDQKLILKLIEKPQGLILVTGPTGSGKTITLYTLLNLLNQHHRNIMTIEDPVEMQIDGINQTNINTKTGLTFSQTLRALLRQDPDVIMIGEIRDEETADIAIRAAQTGHLVLSTLHTNSASETISRLNHMGIAPFHLCSALILVIAQRLARKLCQHCDNGCVYCIEGFNGRTGIFELMPLSDSLKQLMINNASPAELEKQNEIDGHHNLWNAAMQCVNQKLTSYAEINRVVSNHA